MCYILHDRAIKSITSAMFTKHVGTSAANSGKKTSPSKTQKLQRFRAQRCLQVGDCLGYHRDLAQQIQTAKWQLERHLRDPESVRKGQRKKHIDDITSDCPTVLHQLTSLWCCGLKEQLPSLQRGAGTSSGEFTTT